MSNMAPTWVQVGAMLSSKIVSNASKSEKKTTPKTRQEKHNKNTPQQIPRALKPGQQANRKAHLFDEGRGGANKWKFERLCFVLASSLLCVCLVFASCMLRLCFAVLRLCFVFASRLPCLCLVYASSLLRPCLEPPLASLARFARSRIHRFWIQFGPHIAPKMHHSTPHQTNQPKINQKTISNPSKK